MNRMLLLRARLPGCEEPEKSEALGGLEGISAPEEPRPGLAMPVLESGLRRRLVDVLGTLEERLADLGSDKSPGEPGTVRVQVVGKGGSDEALPLLGLRVRLVQRKQGVEVRTTGVGLAVLRPAVSEGAYRVRVWAGEVVLGEVKGTLRPGAAPLHRLEVGSRAELAPYLEQARRWTQSLAGARERVEALRRQAESALSSPVE
jgi:hypothetical protein